MSPKVTLATAKRILTQLKHDKRTIGMIVIVPSVLMIILRYLFDNPQQFNRIGPMLLGIFPFVIMFIVTSIGTLRERTGGTLERLMTTPLAKLDLLLGYALAFGLMALLQVGVVLTISMTWLGLEIQGSMATLVMLAVLNSLLGVALGLFASAFARTEFQAVQLMPALILPQALLCGLFTARGEMNRVLELISNVLPLSYAVDGMRELTVKDGFSGTLMRDIVIIAGFGIVALLLGAATLPRRTP